MDWELWPDAELGYLSPLIMITPVPTTSLPQTPVMSDRNFRRALSLVKKS